MLEELARTSLNTPAVAMSLILLTRCKFLFCKEVVQQISANDLKSLLGYNAFVTKPFKVVRFESV